MKTRLAKNRRLARLVVAAILGGAAFFPRLPAVSAAEREMIFADGRPLFELNYLTIDESAKYWLNSKGNPTMTWRLDGDASVLKDGIRKGINYWGEMLGKGAKNPAPIQILVRTEDRDFVKDAYGNPVFQIDSEGHYSYTGNGQPSINASAEFISVLKADGDEWVKWDLETREEFARLSLQNGDAVQKVVPESSPVLDPAKGKTGYLNINIGKWLGAASRDPAVPHTFGWYINDKTPLPENEAAADFVGTIRHEMGHALGLITQDGEVGLDSIFFLRDADGNIVLDADGYPEADTAKADYYKRYLGDDTIYAFSDVYSLGSFASHLVDERGRAMKPELIIADPAEAQKIITVLRATELPELVNVDENDFFYLSKKPVDGTTIGKAYFIGKNVSEVLGGAKFDGVDGLPVSGWEPRGGILTTDLSHIQLQGMMSHLEYSNYTSLLEAEIAVMQDIGYKIDRRNYYGASVYGDGASIVNTKGYSARNADGTAYLNGVPNKTPLGVGLHIYGSKNDVTQAADILTEGAGAVGIRVDGSENNLTVAKGVKVSSDGDGGIGLLVSYGKNQEINQAGIVSARGKDGRAVRIDFGSSSNGARDEYRGSYIQYTRTVGTDSGDDFTIQSGSSFSYDSMNGELKGPLVKNFNLTGTLIGGREAIYIGKNAFVENINILDGAQISGDIKSDWLNFDGDVYPNLKIVTAAGELDPAKYIPSLTTNLNFNAEINYDGNIEGARNMRLNVKGGELNYGGAANIVSVDVAKGAELNGGTFALNYFTDAQTEGSADGCAPSGTFTNHGTVAAEAAGNLTVTARDSFGSLVSDAGGAAIFSSDGIIAGYMKDGGETNIVSVKGKADINNSSLILKNALPLESAAKVFAADSLAFPPAIRNLGAENAVPVSGMLSSYAVINGGNYGAAATAADNLGERTREEETTYRAMNGMYAELSANGDSRKNEMRPLYNLPAKKVKESLAAIGRNEANPAAAFAAQSSTLVSRVVSNRLNQIFSKTTVPVRAEIPALNLADGETKGIEINFKVDVPVMPDEGAWVKFGKEWGGFASGIDYHSSSVSGGYDWRAGRNRRDGIFAAYSAVSFGGRDAGAGLYDTRIGYYSGWEKGASSAYLYADLGHTRTHTKRIFPHLGLAADGKCSGNIFEMGGEYKYDLTAEKARTWHVSPFIGLQCSYFRQKGYAERGAGIYSQNIENLHNTYFAGEIGAELKRGVNRGSYFIRAGLRHAFAGDNPTLRFRYSGYGGKSYSAASEQDSTHGFLNLGGDFGFARGWALVGEAELQRGAHSRSALATISLRRSW